MEEALSGKSSGGQPQAYHWERPEEVVETLKAAVLHCAAEHERAFLEAWAHLEPASHRSQQRAKQLFSLAAKVAADALKSKYREKIFDYANSAFQSPNRP